MKKAIKGKRAVKIIRWLLLVEGTLFLVFAGVYIFMDTGMVIVGLFVVDSIIFLWLNRVIEKEIKWIFWFAVIFIAVNIILTIIDQFGIVDFLILFLNSFLFVMILGNRKQLALI